MTKKELAQSVEKSLRQNFCISLEAEDIATVINHTLGVIKDAVYNGRDVTLRGFGTFKPKLHKAKKAQDIAAGTTIEIPARYVVAFKPSKDFNIDQNIAL